MPVATETTDGSDQGAGPGSPPRPDAEPRAAATGRRSGGGMMRSSAVMAVGTLVSRVTGFVRTIVLAAALGTQLLGDAYNTANTIPFIINDLLIGGLMASVIVPFLVKRRKRDADGGRATENRLFTGAVLLLGAMTVVAIVAAELLIRLYAGQFAPSQGAVAVYLARFLLAQIFFVGLSGLVSAMLNTRDRFGSPVWAPVLNNLVIIAVGVAFLWVAGPGRTPDTVTQGELMLLGLGTTGGMVLQTVVLLASLRRSGFRWRPRLDLRGSGLGEALRTAGWMFLYTCMTQLGFLITTNIATRAGVASVESGAAVGAGITAYNYAYQLFQLPYAIIAVSLITVLLPQMSGHAADGRWDEVRDGFSRTLRVSALVLVPLAVAIALYATQLSVLVFARGNTSADDARNIGVVLAVMALGLVPFTIFQLMLRVFYAMGDTRTPAMISIANVAVHGALAAAAYLVLPPSQVVVGVAAGFMASFVSGLLIAGFVLSRRLGGLDGGRVVGTLLRLHLAAVPSAVAGAGILWFFTDRFGDGLVTNLGAPITGCLVGALLFVLFAWLLRIQELRAVLDLVRARVLRRG
ncbi:murein biosynthesis integral membrane protein MurJ [Marinitenerispora sediminis]|uniref:Probable lipid II flippase MurJ n=1 Tax=Marinitenerispora sediminis TaxID=1931232 RepID=A0A368T992_9ACTN|nr:murein biosynthesis integral membrane protein MurJ [Marinitenerispora sediminis]RCV55450.1 murein biosynthesis integral membrane protein MurJ [Marinitenerispora sediminis]RCV60796.1 murein biosynthesis integral membrane protein MurJ [Marinitenerispora sediminis]RCV61747.1 murein biosynthesis integral membrane protein MurJ [Marinitenerispora sediminis]